MNGGQPGLNNFSSFSYPQGNIQMNVENKRKNPNALKYIFSVYGLVIGLVAVAGVLGFLYYDSVQDINQLKEEGSVAGAADAREVNEVTDAIKKLVNIDPNEKVNVAKIDNLDELKKENAEFYKNAQNGQYLIVLPESQRVLIYDKEGNRIVNFSSYTIQVEIIPEEEISDSEKPLSIEIRYTADVTSEVIENVKAAIQEASANYNIVSVNQTTQTYEGIRVILLNRESKPKMSQNMVAHAGTNKVSEELPEGEVDSTADVVLILGTLPQSTTE